MNTNTLRRTTLALATFALVTACSAGPPPKLVVDPAMSNAEVFPVTGLKNRYWGKPLTFGPYRTEKTRVGESWSWSAGVFGAGFGKKHDPYRFVFVDAAGNRSKVECRAKTPILRGGGENRQWTLQVGDTQLSCAIQDPDGNVQTVALHGAAGSYRGETGFAGVEDFQISALGRLEGKNGFTMNLPGAFGYELRRGNDVVATVDAFDHGLVYLGPSLAPKERDVAALTLTILMFFEEA